MLLSYNSEAYEIPQSSTCFIHTTGTIKDGDEISITSPVFSSINFTSGEINMSERFTVRTKVDTVTRTIENNDATGNFKGTLICFDNDVFDMYVLLQ
jgi:hypothetical protein